ncbi:hypothetical protein L210DRAFT_3519865 [Boletus edulis BED1]|uniref:Uncharacterized protein n=1 Tax=Boletus edulis BED1 TaxID=1328754 RepID=A0AAD4C9R9_BOLED|nr:hypothetical protein L210DRAFT_3519865 [Boletus edulis BED1]
MGVIYSNDEAIFDLLQGLPDTIKWQIFKELTLDRLSGVTTTSANTSTFSLSPGTGIATSASQSLTFDSVAKLLAAKAHAIVGKRNLTAPRLERASAAIVQSTETRRIHSATGPHTHRNNAKGIRCTSCRCACLPRAANHNIEQCYWPGGVMEEKAPA